MSDARLLTPVEDLNWGQLVDAACMAHPGVFAEAKLGFVNAPFHWEWYELAMRYDRLAVVAPREHAKSEVFSVISTVWFALNNPGSWQWIFSSTHGQARLLMERIQGMMARVDVSMIDNAQRFGLDDCIWANWSRVMTSGAGKAIRGAHPDRIVGDDVMSEGSSLSELHRSRLETWWKGTVGPMAHPGTWRQLGWGRSTSTTTIWYPPTKMVLVGTPFHQMDLLMSMRLNPLYRFVRYDAEFLPEELQDGMWAVELG